MQRFQLCMLRLLYPVDNDEGASAIEYGLLAALISVVIIATARLVGQNLNAVFANIAGQLNTVGGS